MAFAYAVTKKDIMGTHRIVMGTFSQANTDTGRVITTGLRLVENFDITSEVENISVSGGAVTVTTEDPGGAQAGFWKAIGM